MKPSFIIAAGGALAATAAVVFGYKKAAETKKSVQSAVSGASSTTKAKIDAAKTSAEVKLAVDQAAPPAPDDVVNSAAAGDVAAVKDSSWYTGLFQARVTGYWPVADDASDAEKKMEGGDEGAASWRGHRVVDPSTGKRAKLHTLEDVKAGKATYVSVSGDPEVWPFGQLIHFDEWPGVDFRTVDTGGHFKGAGKVYRAVGREPLDVRVASSSTKVIANTTGHIVAGDHYDKEGEAVATSKFQGQVVSVGNRPKKGWSQMRPDLMGPAITPFADETQAWKRGKPLGALHMLGAA